MTATAEGGKAKTSHPDRLRGLVRWGSTGPTPDRGGGCPDGPARGRP